MIEETMIATSGNRSGARQPFGTPGGGRDVSLYALKNAAGMVAQITNFGATLVSLTAPDRNGGFADVVLGYNDVDTYAQGNAYCGAIVGRYGNRIDRGQFILEENEYHVTLNNGRNHLHGGRIGFHKVVWHTQPIENAADHSLRLTYISKNGEEGYPGTLTVTVVYTLTRNNELSIEYYGTTDKTTLVNPTHHSYFNLTGDPRTSILHHELTIAADSITPVDEWLIPTGEFLKVEGGPFDFRTPARVGKRIGDENEQLKFGNGYDHNWVLNGFDGKVHSVAALYEPLSGRRMEVLTDQPGLQVYTGNYLDGTTIGKKGIALGRHAGICLEAQVFPDSPNKPHFPSAVLKPGDTYRQTTIYRFSAK